MKLSIITTFTNKRQDAWREALNCYVDVADEVVVVYDFSEQEITEYISSLKDNVIRVDMGWPFEYQWPEFPRHFNAGLKAATGDWVIKLDVDFFIHEQDKDELRKRLEQTHFPVASMHKMSVYGKHYYSKGNVVHCINRKKGKQLVFGGVIGSEVDDLAGIIDPEYIDKEGVYYGKLPGKVCKIGVNFWNFHYSFKDKETTEQEVARAARAYRRYFKSDRFGKDDLDAMIKYHQTRKEREEMAVTPLKAQQVPKYIRAKYLSTI